MRWRKASASATWARRIVALPARSATLHATRSVRTWAREERRKRRRPLDPIPGYYPAIVAEADFLALQSARLGEHTARHRKGVSAPVSIVAGLAECPACGGTMTRVNKGPRGGKPRLTCVRAKIGRCAARSIVLEDVERALCDSVEEIAATAPIGGEELQSEIDRLDAEGDAVRALMEDAEADWRASRSPAARSRMTRLEAEWDAVMAARKAAEGRRAAAGPGLARRLADYREAVSASPMDRPKVNALLRQMLAAVVPLPEAGMLRLRWHGGGETSVGYAWPKAAL